MIALIGRRSPTAQHGAGGRSGSVQFLVGLGANGCSEIVVGRPSNLPSAAAAQDGSPGVPRCWAHLRNSSGAGMARLPLAASNIHCSTVTRRFRTWVSRASSGFATGGASTHTKPPRSLRRRLPLEPERNHSSSWTMDFDVDLLGRDQRKAPRQVEAHLVAEHAQCAGAGSICLCGAMGVDVPQEVFVLSRDDGVCHGYSFQAARRRRPST